MARRKQTPNASNGPPPLPSATCSVVLAKARNARWWAKLRNNPQRWAERMEKQRNRRAVEEIVEAERRQAREKWAELPKDHPRKRKKRTRTPGAAKARRKRDMEKLPDAVVANQYLHLKVGECPKALIEIKRQHIRLTRMLGTNIKTV